MEISKWQQNTTLLQLMQQEKQEDQSSVVAELTLLANSSSTTLKPSSSSSYSSRDCLSISIINNESSNRSIRINPLEEERRDDDDDEGDDNVYFRNEEDKTKEEEGERKKNTNNVEAWLPITESRKGNLWFCIFHLISSGLGFQTLSIPLAFHALGWAWGITCLSMAFIWQLYTTWLLTQLHESSSGYRYSRYIQLSMAAFGPKLGKLLALFPVMYLSGGACVTLLIMGGGTMQHLYHLVCEDGHICHPNSLTIVEWYIIFICLAILIAQHPNLNSVAWVSLVSAVTAIIYCTLVWVLTVTKGRPSGTKYDPSTKGSEAEVKSLMAVLSAIGLLALSFRGHNLVLEIQGTLPSSPKDTTQKRMWKGVKISYALIAMCVFPLAIGGYWAYGSLMPEKGLLNAYAQTSGNHSSKLKLAIVYFFLIVNCLCSFQIYAMPVFDNFELRYVSSTKKPCTWWIRAVLRVFFGGLVLFISVAAPFLPQLALLIGGIALPITYAYPCFMWISIKKPTKFGAMWLLNLVLGSFGILLSVLLVIAAIYNLATKGLSANFFHPKS